MRRILDKTAAARIEALRHTPGWDDLTSLLADLENSYWQRVLADMKTGKDKAKPVDQREIDYARGLSDGIRALLSAPEKAARIYERLNQEVTVEKR